MQRPTTKGDRKRASRRPRAEGHDDLWRRYRRRHDVATRNALIEAYVPIVAREARKVAAALAYAVTEQELESAGTLGLIDSIDSFDPDQGSRFVTFCTPRVRGAMFDELRSWDWTPRATRAKLNKLQRAIKRLEARLGRGPEEHELAREMGLSAGDIRKLFSDKSRTVVSLDAPIRSGSAASGTREDSAMTLLEDKRGTDPVRDLQKKEIAETVRWMLDKTERLVVTLYYYEEFNLREIGQVLGLTESRICQIHSKIVRRLKRKFA